MDQNKLFNTFLNDGENFTTELGSILLKLEKNPGDRELLNHAFRNAHSLKSEASFLKQTDIIDITGVNDAAVSVLESEIDPRAIRLSVTVIESLRV